MENILLKRPDALEKQINEHNVKIATQQVLSKEIVSRNKESKPKPVAKPVTKPAAVPWPYLRRKPAAKPVTKPAAVPWPYLRRKPVAKPVAKPAAKPVAAPRKPIAAPRKPIAVPKKPIAAPRKPIASPRKPIAAPRKPIAAPKKPIAAPRKPIVRKAEEPENNHLKLSATKTKAALKNYANSYEIDINDKLNALNHLKNTVKILEAVLKKELTEMKGYKFEETLKVTFIKALNSDKEVVKSAYFHSKAQLIYHLYQFHMNLHNFLKLL